MSQLSVSVVFALMLFHASRCVRPLGSDLQCFQPFRQAQAAPAAQQARGGMKSTTPVSRSWDELQLFKRRCHISWQLRLVYMHKCTGRACCHASSLSPTDIDLPPTLVGQRSAASHIFNRTCSPAISDCRVLDPRKPSLLDTACCCWCHLLSADAKARAQGLQGGSAFLCVGDRSIGCDDKSH